MTGRNLSVVKVDIVMVSKDDSFMMDESSLNNVEDKVRLERVGNNRDFLPVVYNKYIRKHREDKDVDYLILQHGDVSYDVKHLLRRLEETKGKYDVIGLCGASKITVSYTPLNWWCGSNPYPEEKWGCVTHGQDGGHMSFYNFHHPDVNDREVAIIDGLCIILTRDLIENTDILFDERFTWDFYDTDFCWNAIFNYHKNIGVIVEKSLRHFSIGIGILADTFLENEIKFREKWKLDSTQKLDDYKKRRKDQPG